MTYIHNSICIALTAVALSAAVVSPKAASAQAGGDPMIGALMTVGFDYCPQGWLAANGQAVSTEENLQLFSLIGGTFNGQVPVGSTFLLPDLRGRVVVGTGAGPGLTSYEIGDHGGVENVMLTVGNLPNHTHLTSLKASSGAADTLNPVGAVLAGAEIYSSLGAPDAPMAAGTALLNNNGTSGVSVDIRGVYQTITTCIAAQGTLPAQN